MIVSKEELSKYLRDLAAADKVAYYTEVYERFCIPFSEQRKDSNPIPLLLAQITNDDKLAKRPFRTSVVVSKEKDKDRSKLIPNDAYFKALCAYRMIPLPATKQEKRELHQNELAALKRYVSAMRPAEDPAAVYLT